MNPPVNPPVNPPARKPSSGAFTFDRLVTFREKVDRQEGRVDAATLDHLEAEYAKKRAEVAATEGVSEAEIDDRVHRRLYPEEELVAADDAVIGRAFRWSLAVIAVLVVLGAAIYLWVNRPAPEAEEQVIEAAAPEAVETEVTVPAVVFADVGAERGLDFVHESGAYGDKLLPETMGGGGAFFDQDGDGDPDLLLVSSAAWPHRGAAAPTPSRLYRNDGSGRFRDATAEVGLDRASFYAQGVAVGDYDNDGDPDLFFTAVGTNRLFEQRDGRFVEVTREAGVGGAEDAWSTGATFFDFDNDGDLDLFVGNYVVWSKEIDFEVDYRLTGVGRAYGPPTNYRGTHSYLYRNDGDGTFTDVSAEAGIQVSNPATGEPAGKALGLAPVDADADGWMDLLVANDTVGNFFFHNRGDGTFEEAGAPYGLAYDRMGNATGAMGVDSAWYRNDPDLGFLIGNFANEMTSVYVSQGDPTLFADEAIGEGIGAPSRSALSFGVFLFDYDLDGRLDVLQTNGHLEEEISSVDPSQQYRQPAQLFWNAGPEARSTFVEVERGTTGDLAEPLIGRGSAYADVDGDGDLDVALFQAGDRAVLLENRQDLGHHWVRLKLEGDPAQGSNRDAIGARVALTAAGSTQVRQVMPTKSYLSQSDLALTFGLGDATEVDSVTITWPDGSEQVLESVPVDGTTVVRQASG